MLLDSWICLPKMGMAEAQQGIIFYFIFVSFPFFCGRRIGISRRIYIVCV